MASKEIEVQTGRAEKTGLQISSESTEWINIDTKDSFKTIRAKYVTSKRVQKFKYLDEIMTPNLNEKPAYEDRTINMKMAFKLSQKSYRSQTLSYQAKLR